MERVLLTRHAESELSVQGILNGDPSVRCGLTPLGREQAQRLARVLATESIEIAITSEFERCRLTAELALGEREPDWLELNDLGDIRNGAYEGKPIDGYRAWAHGAAATALPPGDGESRAAVARRLAAGLRALLARPERLALVVSHSLPVRYILETANGRNPPQVVEPVPYAQAFSLGEADLRRAAERLDAWASAPDW
ncbi:MAG: histidine phosphatase family protein [Gaiellaceae bacterium]